MTERRLIRSGEAARELEISQTYLSRLARSGRLAFTEVPGLGRLYDRADVERFRAERDAKTREPVAA